MPYSRSQHTSIGARLSTTGWYVPMGVGSAPPTSNTGVQITLSPVQAENCVDWIAFTLPESCSFADVDDLLGEREWVLTDRGAMGYRSCRVAPGMRCYFDGQPGMGIHLEISGEGCRVLESTGLWSWQAFEMRLAKLGVHVSRLDLARDDRSGLLDLDTLALAWEHRAVASRWRGMDERRSSGRGGGYKGRTLYFGSSTSDARLRIYDKAVELAGKSDNPDAFLAEHGHHIRVELQLRNDRAAAALREMGRTFALSFLPGLLRSYLDFKARPAREGEPVTRVPSLGAWDAFLKCASVWRLATEVVRRDVERIAASFSKQYGPTLALLVSAFGGDMGPIYAMIKDGRRRWRGSHHSILAEYRGRVGATV